MQRTIYNTPLLRPLISTLCRWSLKLGGWKLHGQLPSAPKFVLIAAPHTSNWDFPLSLAMAFVYKLDMHWMGKDSLFKGFSGTVMRWLGGVPINRSSNNNIVSQTIEKFNRSKRFVIAISPEGTRAKVEEWKTGFYYIALGAKVPIALAYLDYTKKTGGFLSTFHPTGDVTGDILAIRRSYSAISGRHSGQF